MLELLDAFRGLSGKDVGRVLVVDAVAVAVNDVDFRIHCGLIVEELVINAPFFDRDAVFGVEGREAT